MNPDRATLILVACLAVITGSVPADDWPTYRHDNRRSGVTSDSLSLPLEEAWVRRSPIPPMTAWSGPAKWDAYSGNEGLQSMRNFDPAFFVTVAGGSVYFGSSVDHATHCLDAETGEERWVAFAGGAVRLPPTISGDRAFFGADDGLAYCIDAKSGKEIWKHRPAKSQRLIPSDGKLISPWPVRTGALVGNGLVYFGASLVPWETSYLCAVDARTGTPKFVTEHQDVTLQGAMLASASTLYVPQGRSVPLLFSRETGAQLKGVTGAGGTFCLLTEDDKLVAMPANQKSPGDVIQVSDPSGGSARLSFPDADRLIVADDKAYLHQRGKLRAVDLVHYGLLSNQIQRLDLQMENAGKNVKLLDKAIKDTEAAIAELEKSPGADADETKKEIAQLKGKIIAIDTRRTFVSRSIEQTKWTKSRREKEFPQCSLWQTEAPAPYDLILAKDTLLVGGDNQVAAFDRRSGKAIWQATVEGKAYGLAVADGRLFVSSSLGHIYCFAKP